MTGELGLSLAGLPQIPHRTTPTIELAG
jgi:hypothetical protein